MSDKMRVEQVTFGANGRIVIPRRLRRLFGIQEWTKATFEARADGNLFKLRTAALIRRGRGVLKKGGKPMGEEWKEHKQEERALEEK